MDLAVTELCIAHVTKGRICSPEWRKFVCFLLGTTREYRHRPSQNPRYPLSSAPAFIITISYIFGRYAVSVTSVQSTRWLKRHCFSFLFGRCPVRISTVSRLYWMKFQALSPSRQISGWHIKLSHTASFHTLLQFIIHCLQTIRTSLVWDNSSSVK